MAFLNKEMHGHVLLLTMTNPDTRNALTGEEQFGDIEAACAAANEDMSVRAVILTGEGHDTDAIRVGRAPASWARRGSSTTARMLVPRVVPNSTMAQRHM